MTSQLQSFLAYLVEDKQRRPGTIARYREAVTAYLASGLQPAAWLKHPQADGTPISASAYNVRRAALRAWFKFTGQDNVSLPDARKVMRPALRTLEPEEMQRFLAAFDKRPLREQAAALLFYGCGLRRFELIGAKLSDIDLGARLITVEGKGGKPRTVPFPPATAERIQRYITLTRKESSAKDPRLFVGNKGGAYSPDLIVQNVRAAYREAGLDWAAQSLRPVHLIRHCFATDMAEGGTDVTQLQALLGHDNPQTAASYVHRSLRSLRRQVDEAHPLSQPTELVVIGDAA